MAIQGIEEHTLEPHGHCRRNAFLEDKILNLEQPQIKNRAVPVGIGTNLPGLRNLREQGVALRYFINRHIGNGESSTTVEQG